MRFLIKKSILFLSVISLFGLTNCSTKKLIDEKVPPEDLAKIEEINNFFEVAEVSEILNPKNIDTPNAICGNIVTDLNGLTMRQIYNSDDDITLLAKILFGESDRNWRENTYGLEKQGVAMAIYNRYRIVNYFMYTTDDNGYLYDPWRHNFVARNPKNRFGSIPLAEVISYKSQFDSVIGNGNPNLKSGFQSELNRILNVNINSGNRVPLVDEFGNTVYINEECWDLSNNLRFSLMALSRRMEDPYIGKGATVFFNVDKGNPSEDRVIHFGKATKTTFYGFPRSRVRFTIPPNRPKEKSFVFGSLNFLGIADSAQFQSEFSPNMIVSIFGENLTKGSVFQPQEGEEVREWNGVKVEVNGEKSLLYYVGPNQLNIVIPKDLPVGEELSLTVYSEGNGYAEADIVLQNHSPTFYSSGENKMAAGDWSIWPEGATAPLLIGFTHIDPIPEPQQGRTTVVSLYGTGFGNLFTEDFEIRIGQTNPFIQYVGPQGQYEGLYQLNVFLPVPLSSGFHSLEIFSEGQLVEELKIEIY